MSGISLRVKKLEQRNGGEKLTVFINYWLGDGPIARAKYGSEELARQEGEAEEEFCTRAGQWANEKPGDSWGRVVRLEHL